MNGWLEVLRETPESGGGAAPAAEPGGEGAGEAPQVDFGPVLERMEQFESRFAPIAEYFDDDGEETPDPSLEEQQPQWPQVPGQQFGQPGFPPGQQPQVPTHDQYGRPIDPAVQEEQARVQVLQQFIAQQVQEGVQKGIAPYAESQTAYIENQQFEALETRYPELKDPDTAQALVSAAESEAEAMGLEPDRPLSAAFLGLVHRAGVRAQQAEGETPAGQTTGAALEGGGGAGPSPGEPDEATAIVQAGAKRSFLTGSG